MELFERRDDGYLPVVVASEKKTATLMGMCHCGALSNIHRKMFHIVYMQISRCHDLASECFIVYETILNLVVESF